MLKNSLQLVIRSHECVMEGVDKMENADLYTVFSCTEYGGKFQNDAALLLVKKSREVVAKTIPCIKGSTQWHEMKNKNMVFVTRAAEEENDLRSRPITPPRNSGKYR
jgi:protein phosphatase